MRIHFIAIGGSAMHNLALALHQKGYHITGSDDALFEPSKSRLERAGIAPKNLGWYEDNIHKELDAVILGMHAKPDNPELNKAQQLGLPIYSYPEYIYQQSKNKTRVVIAGSHGKTSITAMVLHVMNYVEKEVDFMVGALLDGFDTMVKLTDDNDFIVLEGDEYLSSPIDKTPKFLWYKPNIALISGIAWDHVNVFPTEETYNHQFELFVEAMENGSILVYNELDSCVKSIAEAATKPARKHSYSLPDYQIENGITYLQTDEGPIPLQVFGKHNLNNLMGAKWVCQHMGVDEADFFEAIASFSGAAKRLEKSFSTKKVTVFKDYAHSPSKVQATVHAVKEQFPNQKLLACLELHTYSSLTDSFLSKYEHTLAKADEAVVFYDLEALKIKNRTPIAPEFVAERFNKPGIKVFTNAPDFRNYLFSIQPNNEVVLLMSSGNYGGLDFKLLENTWSD